jgi:hypothetical protein
MTVQPNAKPDAGATRELTAEELGIQADAMNHLGERVRRAVAWAVDHNPYTDVSQIDRVFTAIDFVIHEEIERTERMKVARMDPKDIPF